MKKCSILTVFFVFNVAIISAQSIIYNDAQTLITGLWAAGAEGSATIIETTEENSFEGNAHLQFGYNFAAWWAGCGLNFDNWGASAGRDFSGYSHLRLAYRGLGQDESLGVRLKGANESGNDVILGGRTNAYIQLDIPLVALIGGTSVNINEITELEFYIAGAESANSNVFIDNIILVNIDDHPSAASSATWDLANSVNLGLNLTNWLEAFWLIPFDAFPDFTKYNRNNIQALRDAGFEIFRMPVTFEQITSPSPPYAVDFNHEAIQLVDSLILWANEFDFKLIIDNHHGYDLTDDNFADELIRLKTMWAQLAAHYDYLDPSRFLFEVYNEPHNISNFNFRTVAQALVDTIRQEETQVHTILVGASGYNSANDLIDFIPLNDADIIYCFHNYDPYLFTHQGMSWTTPANFPPLSFPMPEGVTSINNLFASVKTWSDNNDVPVWLGEYGVSTQADAISRCHWIETLTNAVEENGFAHFYWDAISPSDAFGFFENGIVSQANAIDCFENELGLYNNSTTAINPLSLAEGAVFVYPNPSSYWLNVSWKNSDINHAKVEIFDISGRLMKTALDYDGSSPIALAGLKAGIYTLKGNLLNGGNWRTQFVVL